MLIESKKGIGEVIVLRDFNDNLNDANSLVNKFFGTLRIREIITKKYGEGPATFFRGSETIDRIFGIEGISIRQGGYGGTYLTPGDHLYPWVDIEQRDIVGEARDDRPTPIFKKATSKIPSVKKEFNRSLNEAVDEHKLHEKAEALVEIARENKALIHLEAEEYEKIEDMLRRAAKYADNNCWKARVGKVPFSKKQKELLGKIYVLKIIFLRHKLRGCTGRPRSRRLKRIARKCSYNGPFNFQNMTQIAEEIKLASEAYNKFRPKAHEW